MLLTYGRSTWRPADQPTTRRSTWIWCLFNWGQKKYSQEFVFPSFWRTLGELFGVNSYKNPCFIMKRPNSFTKFLGRLRMNFAIGRLFRSPIKENHTRNPCGPACCGLDCGSPCGSPICAEQILPWPARKVTDSRWSGCVLLGREGVSF